MSANPIHDKATRFVQREIDDAIARRDNYAKQLLNVEAEFNDQGEETLSVEEKRAEIEASLREIAAYIIRANEYKAFPPGDLSTTFCPHCFLRRRVKNTSLDLTENIEGEIHCVECKTIIE